MKYRCGFIFIPLITFPTFKLDAQNSAYTDSLGICKTVSDFFGWYIDAIKQKRYSEYQPTFVESKSGNTTLNYTKYMDNLSKHGFSDSAIIKEKLRYQICIDELEKVNYSDFKTKFTDLDDFKNIECDFGNYYRWPGGQEPIDKISIKLVKLKDPFSATAIIEYLEYNPGEEKSIYWGKNLVKLTTTNEKWKIDEISWK